jgi:chemotaxis protein methyltransferase CheR
MFHPSDHNVELSEEEFRLLRDLIHEQFGLFFEDAQRGSLRSRLAGRLSSLGLASFEDYYHYLRFGPQHAEERDRMATHLTNNETYFYREMPQLQVFADSVLKTLKDRKTARGDRKISVLSAGCSSGEEAYTLAMVIYDSGLFFWNWDVQVTGMDVDLPALEKARRAVYHPNSFRSIRGPAFEKHFVKEPGGPRVKDPIRKLVRFRHGNIIEPSSYEGLAPLDVIFCRNVLIYFSDAMILKVVKLFHETLAPGGYLFLGHAESLSRITDLFTPIRFQGAMVYQKAESALARPAAAT